MVKAPRTEGLFQVGELFTQLVQVPVTLPRAIDL
jgi:hypothetical protein